MSFLLNRAGAMVSLALIVGLGWWSYQLAVRDVSGVPVVRALEGPMRVAPEDPGGHRAAYQGLAVNAIAAGEATAPVDEIVLAPQPIDLSDEDTPRRAEAPADAAPAPTVSTAATLAAVDAGWRRDDTGEAGMRDAELTPVAAPAGPVFAPRAVPRPPPRARQVSAVAQTASDGDDLAQLVASQVAARAAPSDGRDIDPDSIQPGTRLVQLGTFSSEEEARSAWTEIARRFTPHLDERGRVIEAARSGGSVFYRLRAHGFEGEADARRFCAVLLAQNADCIPVLIR